MSRERELLERLLKNFERPVTVGRFGDLFDEVRELLSTPEPTQDEPVDISDTLKPTNVAMLPNGVAVSNVYEAYEAGLKEGSLQDEEPVAWIREVDIDNPISALVRTQNECGDCNIPLFLRPAPRPEFVRLTEEEVNSLMNRSLPSYELICAVENRLVEKNSINRSDPDSIDLQSRCRGDKL